MPRDIRFSDHGPLADAPSGVTFLCALRGHRGTAPGSPRDGGRGRRSARCAAPLRVVGAR